MLKNIIVDSSKGILIAWKVKTVYQWKGCFSIHLFAMWRTSFIKGVTPGVELESKLTLWKDITIDVTLKNSGL